MAPPPPPVERVAVPSPPAERVATPPPTVEPIALPRHLEPIAPPPVQRTEPAGHIELERAEPPRTIRTTRTIETPRTFRTTRPVRTPQTIRTARTPRTSRTFQSALGLAALAVLAFVTITVLNEIRYRLAQQPDALAVARAADIPAPLATTPSGPSAIVSGMTLADAMATIETDAGVAPVVPAVAAAAPAVAPTKQQQPPSATPARNVAPPVPTRETARAPERRAAAAPPPRPPVSQSVTPRIVDLAPPSAPTPAATTGITPPFSTPPSTTQQPSTAQTSGTQTSATQTSATQTAATQPPAASAVVAAANPPVTSNTSAAVDPPATVRAPTAAPAAAGTPAVGAAPPASPPTAARVAIQRAEVESVLGRYARAFSSLDAGRAKAVWPSVNQRNLERAFDTLEQQEFDLGACEISVLPPQATALCDGTARYTPKVGNRRMRTESRRWTFLLRQNGPNWAIESVDSR